MVEEKLYTIPLRKSWLKQTTLQRSPRAIREIRRFLSKHMKAEDVWISPSVNDFIWKRGAKKPPAKIRLKAIKEEDRIKAYLENEETTKKAEKGKMGKLMQKIKKAPKPLTERLPSMASPAQQ